MIEVQVRERRKEADAVAGFVLETVSGEALPDWEPGAHIDVELTTADGKTVLRQYSLCGEVDDPRWRIAVLDTPDSRGGSRAMHSEIDTGKLIRVSEPRNNFPLHEGDAPAVLIAGGIGVTPILPMARELHRRGARFRMHYQYRSETAAAFLEELKAAPFAESVTFGSDSKMDPKAAINAALKDADPKGHFYVCGPAGFIEAAEIAAAAAGFSAHRIHRELFSAAQAAVDTEDDEQFELVLAESGFSVLVPPGKTAVAALEEAGVDVPVSCEQGVCGSCLTKVLEGEPDHRDAFLMPEERKRGDYFTPCCSRARSERLVVAL
ncbi:MAG: oxidoreductase [Ectothiorhodospiraceae bacterium]|nr:oxidoreductase [Ectothiorhodospiraceae bacterium]